MHCTHSAPCSEGTQQVVMPEVMYHVLFSTIFCSMHLIHLSSTCPELCCPAQRWSSAEAALWYRYTACERSNQTRRLGKAYSFVFLNRASPLIVAVLMPWNKQHPLDAWHSLNDPGTVNSACLLAKVTRRWNHALPLLHD